MSLAVSKIAAVLILPLLLPPGRAQSATAPPVITSPLSATGSIGQQFIYQFEASGATMLSVMGLPAGLTFDAGLHAIIGTPTEPATPAQVQLSATNEGGTTTATLFLTIPPPLPTPTPTPTPTPPPPDPVINSPLFASTNVGQSFSYQITATNSPTSFDATNLPADLMVDTGTGLISGTPTVIGTFQVNLSATNAFGTGTAVLTLDVSPVGAPAITSASTGTTTEGQSFSYQITATNSPTSFDATDLPADLTVDTSTGLISGTTSVNGTFQVNLSATNSFGTGNAVLTLTVNPPIPTHPLIISSTSATGRVAEPFNFQVITTGGDSSTRLAASGLPTGLTVDAVTGIISGVVTTELSSSITLTAIGDFSSTASLQLTFTSDPARPVIISDSGADLTVGKFFRYTIVAPASGSPDGTAFLLFGTLPPGLIFDPVAGTISGTFFSRSDKAPRPGLAGGVVTNVQLFATNSSGTGTIPLTFFVVPSGAVNISTRLNVGTGDDVLIGGFITQGNAAMKLVLRGIGPSLPLIDPLADPFLELHDSTSTIASNDSWRVNLDPTKDPDQSAAILATKVAPTNDLESAILGVLDPGSYTAIVRGTNNSTGVGLVEVYNLGAASLDAASEAHLANISTRGNVQAGDNVMIGGFINEGAIPIKVLVRAIGPSLGMTGVLANPILELYEPGGTVITNDDWMTDPIQKADIMATTIPPSDELESAIVITLPVGEGAYTAIVKGVNNTTGVGLVEAYFGNPVDGCLGTLCP